MKFLISRLSSLGDIVCSLPAASALKAGFPDSEVTWIVSETFFEIPSCCAAIDIVVPIAKKRVMALYTNPPSGKAEYEAALDLQGLFKSASMIVGAKAKRKVGYHWQREGSALFSQAVVPDPTSLHVVDQYVDVARAVGGVADRAEFALVPDPEATILIRQRLGSNFVALNPGAAWTVKQWPPQRFAQLADMLSGEGFTVVLIGGKESVAAAEVEKLCKSKPINLSGETSLAELVALIGLAKAHVGGDTGSSHIAAALGIPAVGLYSATRPERSCPYGQIDRCHYDPRGLDYIEAADVFKTVREAIS